MLHWVEYFFRKLEPQMGLTKLSVHFSLQGALKAGYHGVLKAHKPLRFKNLDFGALTTLRMSRLQCTPSYMKAVTDAGFPELTRANLDFGSCDIDGAINIFLARCPKLCQLDIMACTSGGGGVTSAQPFIFKSASVKHLSLCGKGFMYYNGFDMTSLETIYYDTYNDLALQNKGCVYDMLSARCPNLKMVSFGSSRRFGEYSLDPKRRAAHATGDVLMWPCSRSSTREHGQAGLCSCTRCCP